MSRLKTATNPESGTIIYGYDLNINLTGKYDARTIITTYAYDALNRVKSRSYNDGITPTVSYYYDNLTNAKGKLLKVTNGTGADRSTTEYTAFDISGRVTASKQTTDGVTYGNGSTDSLMTYSYNLGGGLIEQQYPSGRVVKNVLDNSGDLAVVQSKKNAASGFWHYADAFTYNPAGAVTSMQLGNGRWESTTFNSRLQPTQIGLGTTPGTTDKLDLDFTYGSTANNGNITSQTITVPGMTYPLIQTYTYDSLNRLATAVETSNSSPTWKQKFSYDRYGNRRFDFSNGDTTVPASNCTEAMCNPTISTTNNRLTSSGYNYDSSGNTTFDASLRKFTYDGENKQTKVESTNTSQQVTGTVGEYFYDGDGNRVKKYVPSTGETTIFVYDATGKQIAEYSTIVEAPSTAKVAYLTNDHLGSPRINTDANGAVTSHHDYHPFGEEIDRNGFGSDTIRKQFTSKERDNEAGLDYFVARYYVSLIGRFSSADPLFIELRRLNDPQRLNLYAYTHNNPIKFTDPTGLDIEVTGTEQDEYRKRLQSKLTFRLQINSKTNKIEIVNKDGNVLNNKELKALGKTLMGGEKELFTAITDSKNHVSIETVRNDGGVFFGAFVGGGKQKIDLGDVDLLDSYDNAGGFSAGTVIGHETLEGYAASKGSGFNDAHAYANGFFGGLAGVTQVQGSEVYDVNKQHLLSFKADYQVVGNPGVASTRVTHTFVTPIPMASINTLPAGSQLNHVTKVEKVP